LYFLSCKASTWSKIILGFSLEFSGKGLNFKNVFNSFKVEIKESGPRIFTFKLCIY
jgi:hypothetical protein